DQTRGNRLRTVTRIVPNAIARVSGDNSLADLSNAVSVNFGHVHVAVGCKGNAPGRGEAGRCSQSPVARRFELSVTCNGGDDSRSVDHAHAVGVGDIKALRGIERQPVYKQKRGFGSRPLVAGEKESPIAGDGRDDSARDLAYSSVTEIGD